MIKVLLHMELNTIVYYQNDGRGLVSVISTLLVSYTCLCVIYEAMAQAAAHKLIRHIPSHYDHEEQY